MQGEGGEGRRTTQGATGGRRCVGVSWVGVSEKRMRREGRYTGGAEEKAEGGGAGEGERLWRTRSCGARLVPRACSVSTPVLRDPAPCPARRVYLSRAQQTTGSAPTVYAPPAHALLPLRLCLTDADGLKHGLQVRHVLRQLRDERRVLGATLAEQRPRGVKVLLLQRGHVDEEGGILLGGLGDHVQDDVRHLDGRRRVAAHSADNDDLVFVGVLHHQLGGGLHPVRDSHASATKLVHLPVRAARAAVRTLGHRLRCDSIDVDGALSAAAPRALALARPRRVGGMAAITLCGRPDHLASAGRRRTDKITALLRLAGRGAPKAVRGQHSRLPRDNTPSCRR